MYQISLCPNARRVHSPNMVALSERNRQEKTGKDWAKRERQKEGKEGRDILKHTKIKIDMKESEKKDREMRATPGSGLSFNFIRELENDNGK